ncbi:Sphingosine kinase 1 [Apostasia shenzhenica]|uniref:Sphingosine kinase 1 n=1 Tax=Apostasia shenzhenica TaxID=1088818 RepID=A0A2I0B023_9ASPA|nr:Sphingosine kinase 1 [Apostasia shenzhenica]
MDASAALSSTLFLDRVGEVVVSLNSCGLSWNPTAIDSDASSCCRMAFQMEVETEIKFSNVYAVEFTGLGSINERSSSGRSFLLNSNCELYRFVVHGFQKAKNGPSPCVLSAYTFGHRDLQACQTWVDQINACIQMQVERPKNLLVFVHPRCGKGNGLRTWQTVAPMFSRAKVMTKVTVTRRAGHAFDILKSSTDRDLSSFDGVVSVGGDGLFNEVLNGILSSRHKAPYPPDPTVLNTPNNSDELRHHVSEETIYSRNILNNDSDIFSETSEKCDDCEPLLPALQSTESGISKLITSEKEPHCTDHNSALIFPNDWFRLGIIPAGSTDAIVISTTGIRDPVTSALHIILGRRISLDVAQVVRWKTTPTSLDTPLVHYAASFAGYGFYGDVVKESEKYRWMGPSRYDFTGTKVFLEHRSYEAEVGFLAAKEDDTIKGMPSGMADACHSLLPRRNLSKEVCRIECSICNGTTNSSHIVTNGGTSSPIVHGEGVRWLRSKGRFLSVGAAVISCRNERAPDGLVADAHLSDGFLHLILVKDCPRPFYLWHLTKLTRKGADPLDFSFVEHHKTNLFTFVANHDGSVWNLDGELLQACQVTVRACRGLVNLFAAGPEV